MLEQLDLIWTLNDGRRVRRKEVRKHHHLRFPDFLVVERLTGFVKLSSRHIVQLIQSDMTLLNGNCSPHLHGITHCRIRKLKLNQNLGREVVHGME
jgi:hypothetical protein